MRAHLSARAPQARHSHPAAPRRRSSTFHILASATEAPTTPDIDPIHLENLSPEAVERALAKKANKFEKVKAKKCGSRMWTEVSELAQLIREGKTSWEDLDLDDIDVRLKWAGLFHRRKRNPGTFMMRLKVFNGIVNADQLRYLAACIRPYGELGCADITTRANFQLRGVTLEDSDKIIDGLKERGMTSLMSGMDNVRNLTGSPIGGIDPFELLDVNPLLKEMQNMITDNGKGRAELTNLPRKINICVSPSRDDFPHTHINDLGYEAVQHPDTGEILFNVVVGGYFSGQRNVMSLPLGASVTYEQVVPFAEAVLKVFRDHGSRANRAKTRLMWLVEEMGTEAFTELVKEYMGGAELRPAVHPAYDAPWPRRDVLGVHPQKQEGFSWVGACVPAGRLFPDDLDEFARVAEKYGDGTARLTCEENILFPNIANDNLEEMLAEPMFERFEVNAGPLTRAMVSCTGSQFCGFGLVETKNRAISYMAKLEQELDLPRPVRLHWTGCPNSCGQAQVGDIGIMGAPAKLDGKAVEGVKIFVGGKVGENPDLAKEFAKGIPADEEHLLPRLREILIESFGATPKAA